MQTPLEEISDEHILSLLKLPSAAERGFKLLLDKYQERLYRHIRRMVVEHEDANDVVQNCLIRIFRSIRDFEGKSKLYTWLYRVATNEAITFLNKKARRAASSLDDKEMNFTNRLKADIYFDGDMVQIRLQQALLQLPEKQRVVFNLRYYEEMSYKDMAETLDTSVGALKASYHHAVKKIEHFLREVEI